MSERQVATNNKDSNSRERSPQAASHIEKTVPENIALGNQSVQSLFSHQGDGGNDPSSNNNASNDALSSLQSFLQSSSSAHTTGTANIHKTENSDHVLRQFNSPGLAVGNQVLLSRQLQGAYQQRVLNHELNHVAQAGGRAPANYQNLKLGARHSAEEKEANKAQKITQARSGFDVNTVRLFDPDEEGSADDNAVCNPDWSFDPYLEDFSGSGNGDIVLRTLSTREWLQNHSIIELDYEAYSILLDRLDRVRRQRIDMGHLWLEEIEQGTSTLIYQMVPGAHGAMDIVAVENTELITGNPGELGAQPIMTMNQLNAFAAEQGLQQMDLTTFLQDASAVRFRSDEEFAEPGYTPLYTQGDDLMSSTMPTQGGEYAYTSNLDMWLDEISAGADTALDSSAMGSTGAIANSSTRNRLLAEAFANHNPNSRAGSIAEAYSLTNRQSLYGFGVMDRNHMPWEHPSRGTQSGNFPLGDQRNFTPGYPTEGSVKMRRSGTTAAASPSAITRYQTYLKGYAQMLNMDAGYSGFDHFRNNAGNGRTDAQIRSDFGLIVSADDVDAVRGLLADPTGFDLTENGNQSTTPNYQRTDIRNIYDGLLSDDPIRPNDGGSPLSSIQQIDDALQTGRIGIMQHDMYLREIANTSTQGIHSNTDFNMTIHNRFEAAYNDMHPSLRPEAPTDGRPVLHRSTRSRTGTAASSNSHIERYGNYLDRLGSVVPDNNGALHVDVDDAAPLRELLRNPLGHDSTRSGGTSRTANFQRSRLNTVYNSVLQNTPVTAADGVSFNSVEAIHSAFDAGNIDARQYSALMHRVGRLAANQVQPRTDAVVQAHEDAMADFRRGQSEYREQMETARQRIRGNNSPEYMDWVANGRGMQGDLHLARSYGGRGALLGAGMGMLTEGGSMLLDGEYNPDAAERLATAAGREGLRGGLSSTTEAIAMSRVSQYLLREGVEEGAGRAIAMRAGARFVPGVTDMIFEGYDMATDGRDNSATEIGVRSTRALVIGGTSSVLGAVAGAAATGAVAGSVVPGVGTAIGFVAGLVVGVGTALFLNAVIPGGREDWGPEAEERRRRERQRQSQQPRQRRPACFAAGTQIRLANGSEKNIEELMVGDQLFAYDTEQKVFKIERITQLHTYGVVPTIEIDIEGLQRSLKITAEHPLYDGEHWKAAKNFAEADAITTVSHEGELQAATVAHSKPADSVPVFNLTVTGCNTYIANDVLAHNMQK